MVALHLASAALAAGLFLSLPAFDAGDPAGAAVPQDEAGGTSWLAFPDEPLGRPWASVGAGPKAWAYLTDLPDEFPVQ